MIKSICTALFVAGLLVVSANAASNPLCSLFGIGCPVANAPPPFVPVYLPTQNVISPFSSKPMPMNTDYFLTLPSATTLCQKLGCAFVFSGPCKEVGAPYTCSAEEVFLAFKDCSVFNAGILAAYYTRNPEALYPNVAYNAIVAVMKSDNASAPPSCPIELPTKPAVPTGNLFAPPEDGEIMSFTTVQI